mmetsp:Transcript_29018/g.67262  ORF Transcript_29018/g.67262 Transcript_29018/m.67262 type:complete len:401 (+) Transcript_29018:4387-5589(+)
MRQLRQLCLLALGDLLLGDSSGRVGGDVGEQFLALVALLVDHHLLHLQLLLLHLDVLVGLNQFGQTTIQAAPHVVVLLSLTPQKDLIVLDKVQIVLRRHVVVSPQPSLEVCARCSHRLVHSADVLDDLRPQLGRQVLTSEELLRNANQRLHRPGREPVDHSVVDEAGEVSAALAQCVADRGHGQDNVQVVTAPVHVEIPAVVLGFHHLPGNHVLPHCRDQRVLLLLRVQCRHHAGRQHVVDQLQEALLGNMSVGEQEHNLLVLRPKLGVQGLEVLAELHLRVPTGECDLEHLALGHVGSETSQALLPGATDTNQQQVPPRQTQRSLDARQVLQCVVKQHEVHLLVHVVVVGQRLPKHSPNRVVAPHVLVQARHRVALVHRQVVAKQNRVLGHLGGAVAEL